jgi:transposase
MKMKKRSYRAQSIASVALEVLQAQVKAQRLVVSIDIAKTKLVAALMTEDREVQALVKWQHPQETAQFFQLVSEQLPWSSLEVAMEPSGSYGDPLRSWFNRQGYAVFRVNSKRCHDAAEIYDGVPSLHDAKAAMLIGWLHLDGLSERWAEPDQEQRSLRAKISTLEWHDEVFYRHVNHLEGQLARYWPELTAHLELTSVTLLELLSVYGSPMQVSAQVTQARALMKQVGRAGLADETIEQVIQSARTSVGVPCLGAECEALQRLAAETRRAQQAARAAEQALIQAGLQQPSIQAMAPVLGKRTAVILGCLLGPPERYTNAASYLKAMGLNLKERSSGQHQGRLMITKRGSGTVRRYLYLAALRLIQKEPLMAQWYEKKVSRDGGRMKMKAVVAVMRKLARALWHVGQGQPFDITQLIDVNRLNHPAS